MTKYRIEVDRTTCRGFGACVELCPSSFYLSDNDGKSKIIGGHEVLEEGRNIRDVIDVDDIGCFGRAEEVCPFNAINVLKD